MVTVTIVVAAWCLAAAVWLYETSFWLAVWSYFGMFVGVRWMYRNNVLGQTVSSLSRRPRTVVRIDPDAEPIDLGDWDGSVRQQG